MKVNLEHTQVLYGLAIIFLGFLSCTDIKEQKLSLKTITAFAVLIFICYIYPGKFEWHKIVWELLPGAVLLLIGIITKEAIGYGDCITVIILGIALGFSFCMAVCCLSFLLTGAYAISILIKQKIMKQSWNKKFNMKKTIPFVPFLLISMEVLLIYAG